MTEEQQKLLREKVNSFMAAYCVANPDYLRTLVEELTRYKWIGDLLRLLELHIGDHDKIKEYLEFDPYIKE